MIFTICITFIIFQYNFITEKALLHTDKQYNCCNTYAKNVRIPLLVFSKVKCDAIFSIMHSPDKKIN